MAHQLQVAARVDVLRRRLAAGTPTEHAEPLSQNRPG